jgi:DNA mismatch repair protein MutS2
MHLYPQDVFSSIEFDKILEILAQYCLGSASKKRVLQLSLYSNLTKIEALLEETREYLFSIDQQEEIPFYGYESIKEDLFLLKKDGYVLEVEAIFRIQRIIALAEGIIHHFTSEYKKKYPVLFNIADQIIVDKSLNKLIDNIFDKEGNIKPNASPDLAKIFKEIKSKEREASRIFADRLKKLKQAGLLTDNAESVKNGRRVLSVASEHKRRINGMIHDESASGKTVFIEPEEVIFINNYLFELELQKKQEIYRILKDLCHDLRPYAEVFELWEKIIIRLDLIRAKAKFAISYDGKKPKLNEEQKLYLKEAYHPLLLLKNSTLELKTVPFTLELNADDRMLVISGPNAGGKSITMKSVALLQTMLQAGLLIPVDSDSSICIFKKLFADIGDQQSLEDDLSTYSSRLNIMKYMMEKADKNTLVLIDEFGSGTDPKIGGAIAEAILDRLNKKKVYGVITTHYSNLKVYSYNAKGILNGAMLFDHVNHQPTYQLQIGKPGSSFAFEIAERIGLHNKILAYAKNKAGKDSKAIDDLLIDLVREKEELEEKLTNLISKEDRLKKLIASYESMNKDLEFRRRKIKLEAKEKEFYSTAESDKEIQKLIKELRENQNLEKAKALSKTVREKKSILSSEIHPLKETLQVKTNFDVKDLRKGDYVKLRSGGQIAELISIKKNKAELMMGMMKVMVPLKELLPANEPIHLRKGKSVKTDLVHKQGATETSLDIKGYKYDDALDFVQEFLDNALISNLSRVKIIHGVGSGVLRKMVRKKLREYKDVKKVWHPEDEMGGQGVTFVDF